MKSQRTAPLSCGGIVVQFEPLLREKSTVFGTVARLCQPWSSKFANG